jgi:hypothetical protein
MEAENWRIFLFSSLKYGDGETKSFRFRKKGEIFGAHFQ